MKATMTSTFLAKVQQRWVKCLLTMKKTNWYYVLRLLVTPWTKLVPGVHPKPHVCLPETVWGNLKAMVGLGINLGVSVTPGLWAARQTLKPRHGLWPCVTLPLPFRALTTHTEDWASEKPASLCMLAGVASKMRIPLSAFLWQSDIL